MFLTRARFAWNLSRISLSIGVTSELPPSHRLHQCATLAATTDHTRKAVMVEQERANRSVETASGYGFCR